MINKKTGISLAVFTALISGCSIFYNKIFVVKGIDSLVFNIIKNGGVAFILTALLLLRGKINTIKTLALNDWKKLFTIGLVGGGIPFWLFFEGLKTVPALNANVIQKTLFIWVALLAIPYLKEKLNRWQILGYIAILWSNVLFGFNGFTATRGEWMILSATLLWSVENVISAYTLRKLDPGIVSWARMFFGAIFLFCVAVTTNKASLIFAVTPTQLPAIAGSIMFLSVYVLSWYAALKYAPATVATAVLVLATPITGILSVLFLSQPIASILTVPFAATILGTVLIAVFAHEKTEQSKTASL